MRTAQPTWRHQTGTGFRSALALAMLLTLPLAAPALATDEAKAPASLRGELLQWIEDAEKKLLELADATPEEKYAWRPAEGVRTTGEVFLHVAAANYGIPSQWGIAAPAGFSFATYEASLKKKAEIRGALEQSFAHMKAGFAGLSDEALAKDATVFGQSVTVRWGYLLLLSHAHEHLGQSIAYARSNNITPPWTARQQEAKKAKEKGSGE